MRAFLSAPAFLGLALLFLAWQGPEARSPLSQGGGVSGQSTVPIHPSSSTAQVDGGEIPAPAPLDASSEPSDPMLPPPISVSDRPPTGISAEYAIVLDGDSGQVLWGGDPHSPVAPASLAKIATTLVVLERASLSDRIVVQVDSRTMRDSTVMGIEPGEELTVEDLLHGMMLPSGNDAARALADHISGSRPPFADLMNAKARSLGLTNTNFVTVDGWDARGQYTTAYDIAMLAREGMRHPVFRDLAAARSYETGNGQGYTMANLNRLLGQYPGADGVKIGYTTRAGQAIVASAVRDGHRVYVALMRSQDRYADAARLLDWAFASHVWP